MKSATQIATLLTFHCDFREKRIWISPGREVWDVGGWHLTCERGEGPPLPPPSGFRVPR